jgi:hypothetical protein
MTAGVRDGGSGKRERKGNREYQDMMTEPHRKENLTLFFDEQLDGQDAGPLSVDFIRVYPRFIWLQYAIFGDVG